MSTKSLGKRFYDYKERGSHRKSFEDVVFGEVAPDAGEYHVAKLIHYDLYYFFRQIPW